MTLTDFEPKRCADFNPNFDFNRCMYYDPDDDEKDGVCGFCKMDKRYRCIALPTYPIPLSTSSVSDFLTCHYLYFLKAICGVTVKDHKKSDALKMGVLWDNALQFYLEDKTIDLNSIIDKYQIREREVAKVRGVYKAYKKLDIQIDPGFTLQHRFNINYTPFAQWSEWYPGNIYVTGVYDRKYLDSFAENKFTSKPDNYLDPYFIKSQIATYFLADPSLSFCTMEIIRTPDLKSTKSFKDESPEDLGERIYQDAISRPSHYFSGYDRKTHRYGKRYYRSEFNLDEVKARFTHIFREIHEAKVLDGWYKNDRVCNNVLPGFSCDMLPICRTGHFNDEMFEIRKRRMNTEIKEGE